MNIWRLRRGGAGGVLILDWRTLRSLAVTPDLNAWLSDAQRQPQALAWYAALTGDSRNARRNWTPRELDRQVKPRLQQAFREGELIALPRDVVTGGKKAVKDNGPEDLTVLTRSELERSKGAFELEHWLNDAMLLPLLLEIYRAIGGFVERVQWTHDDLHRYVKPRLQEALRNKELFALAQDLLPQRMTGTQSGQSQGPQQPRPQPPAPPVPFHPRTAEKEGLAAAVAPAKKSAVTAAEKTWIEILLRDEEGNPVAGESYRITLPDGRAQTGKLDEKGRARVDGIDPGSCQITFPDLDAAEWKPM